MKLVIQTQAYENYGISETFDRWKPKFGTTFVMRNLTQDQIKKIAACGIPHLCELINTDTRGWREKIISSQVVNDDAFECEEWETPWELGYSEAKGGWTANRFIERQSYWQEGVVGKWEGYVMAPNGEMKDFTHFYQKEQGAA